MSDILGDDSSTTTSSRNELIAYMLSILRSHAGENGDDLPIIEFNALKALAFVADAFLMFVDMLEKFDIKFSEAKYTSEKVPSDVNGMEMFQELVCM